MASNKKSFVCKFFKVIEQEGGGKGAKCSLSSSVLPYSGSSTSSLGKHLTVKHPGGVPQSKASPSGLRQANVAGYFKQTENRRCNAERRQKLFDKLLQIIYQDIRPLSLDQFISEVLELCTAKFSCAKFCHFAETHCGVI